jgi:hypothetical protein
MIVSCPTCGWTAAAERGDLVVTKQDDGRCVSHKVIHLGGDGDVRVPS